MEEKGKCFFFLFFIDYYQRLLSSIYRIEKNYNELFISFANIFEINQYEFKRKKFMQIVNDEEIKQFLIKENS